MIRFCDYCEKEGDCSAVGFAGSQCIYYCNICKERLNKEKDIVEQKDFKIEKSMSYGTDKVPVYQGEGLIDVPFTLGVETISNNTKQKKGDNNMENWIKEEQDRLASEREEAMKEKGFETLWRFPQGETKVKLDPSKKPEQKEFQGRKVYIFDLEVAGEQLKTGINSRSPLYREFINKLAAGKFEFTVIRAGDGLNTRYSLKD